DDVLVLQPGRRPRLAAEAIEHLGLRGEAGRQDLQGHDAVKGNIACLVDRPHAAAGHEFKHRVLADAVARLQAFAYDILGHRSLLVKRESARLEKAAVFAILTCEGATRQRSVRTVHVERSRVSAGTKRKLREKPPCFAASPWSLACCC